MWSVKCKCIVGVRNEECKVWSVKCKVCSVKRRVWREGVRSVEYGVQSAKREINCKL